jgi:DUF4097 and DUF4098 domain-containing protein YvlB
MHSSLGVSRVRGAIKRTSRAALPAALLLLSGATGCSQAFKASHDFALSAPWQDYERVVVRTRNGNVDMATEPGGDIAIDGQRFARGATPGQAEERVDQVEVVAAADPDDASTFVIEVRFPDELRHASAGANFRIRVPQACKTEVSSRNGRVQVRGGRDEVAIETSNGGVVVEAVEGDVRVHTSNGSIRAADIRGSLLAETSNGRIDVASVVGECTLNSSNGRIEARETSGELTAVSSNGSIVVEAAAVGDGKMMVRTSNGSIRLTLPADTRAGVTLQTTNGGVYTNLGDAGIRRASHARGWFEGELNGGGSGMITARTSNGRIDLTCR